MGSTMACCGKQDEDPNNIVTGGFTKWHYTGDKIYNIIKIQAIFRGYLARKRVKALKSSEGIKSMMNNFNYNGPANYENPEV